MLQRPRRFHDRTDITSSHRDVPALIRIRLLQHVGLVTVRSLVAAIRRRLIVSGLGLILEIATVGVVDPVLTAMVHSALSSGRVLVRQRVRQALILIDAELSTVRSLRSGDRVRTGTSRGLVLNLAIGIVDAELAAMAHGTSRTCKRASSSAGVGKVLVHLGSVLVVDAVRTCTAGVLVTTCTSSGIGLVRRGLVLILKASATTPCASPLPR